MKQNPIRLALNNIAGNAAQVKFYDEHLDFKWLWGQIESKPDCFEQLWVVVATDHVLQASSGLKSWTSVDAWCHALAAVHGKDMPHVLLLDLRTDDPPQRILDWDEKLAWWPRLNRFLPEPSADGKIRFLDELIRAIRNSPTDGDTNTVPPSGNTLPTPSRTDRFDKIRQYAQLIDSNDRHDVSNELGALIMRAGMILDDKTTDSGRNRAARILVEALLGQEKWEEGLEHIPSLVAPKPFLSQFFPDNPTVILVDDRHDKGYGQVLSDVLGHKVAGFKGLFDPSIEDGNDATKPMKVLGTDLAELGKRTALHAFDADMLFLDLRLWRTSINQTKAQKKYDEMFRQLGFADQIVANQGDENSHRRLALIPKMLASIDPGLPIILFSSTQHRSVTQAVHDVPNIITDFAKPYIGGKDPDEYDPATVLKGLQFAVEKAAKMAEIRVVWRQACLEWEGKNLNKLNWGQDCGWKNVPLSIESPLDWLRNQWLPLAQRQEYALAAAAPWIWLHKTLGETRIAILSKQSKGQLKCLLRLKHCHSMPMLKIEPKSAAAREFAIVAGLSLVKLIGIWTDK